MEIKLETIRQWTDQLKFLADEAGDARLLAVESDLLDIREELDRLLD